MRRCVALTLLAVLALASSAHAAPAQPQRHRPRVQARVVLLTLQTCCPARAWAAAERRVAAEIQTLGPAVVLVPSSQFGATAQAQQQELKDVTARFKAVAALRIHRSSDGAGGVVQIYRWNPARQRPALSTIPLTGATGRSVALLALRVTELLRGSLRRGQPLHPPARAARPNADVRPLPRLTLRRSRPCTPIHRTLDGWGHSRLAARLDLGYRNDKGDRAHLQLRAVLSWYVHPNLALDITTATSLVGHYPSLYDASEWDRYQLGFVNAQLWARWEIVKTGRFRPSLGLGFGALYVYTNTRTRDAPASEHDSIVLAELTGTAQLAIGLTPRIWLRFSLEISVGLPDRTFFWPEEPRPSHPIPNEGAYGTRTPYMWIASLGLEIRLL